MVAEGLKSATGQFLVAGTDSAKGHIYTISDFASTLQDHPGYATVGSGASRFLVARWRCSAHKQISLEEAFCLTYEAKKLAEGMYGVGKKTDVGVVGEDRSKACSGRDDRWAGENIPISPHVEEGRQRQHPTTNQRVGIAPLTTDVKGRPHPE